MEQSIVFSEQRVYCLLRRKFNIQVAVCDDEKDFREDLKEKIYAYSNIQRLEIAVDEYVCGEDLVASETIYDIIFLDYKMGELDGLNAARILRGKNLNCAIIFLTNYPNFVYESFEVNTFRFFEKPMDADKLKKALDDYIKKFGNDYPILLRSNREVRCIDTKNIVYLEADNKSCVIHLDREPIRCARTMAKVSNLLPQNHFYKVHRAFIVNLNYIRKYDNERIYFKNGDNVYVGRKYYTPFKTTFMQYSKNLFVE